MYRVLIPVDTSEERALAQAEYVTSLPNAAESVEAYLLFVFTEDSDDLPQEFETFKSASRIGSVRRAQEALEDAGIEVTILETAATRKTTFSRKPGPTTSTRSFSAAESARRSGKRSSAALPRGIILSSGSSGGRHRRRWRGITHPRPGRLGASLVSAGSHLIRTGPFIRYGNSGTQTRRSRADSRVVDSSMTSSFRLSPQQIDGITDGQFADEAIAEKIDDEDTSFTSSKPARRSRGRSSPASSRAASRTKWGEVNWLFVDPEHRGKGIGTELYETATEDLRDRGADHVCVTVLEANTEGHQFVERFGLEHDGDRRIEVAGESPGEVRVHGIRYRRGGSRRRSGRMNRTQRRPNFPETETTDGHLTATNDDGKTVYIARDEEESGTAASFYVTYEDEAHEEQYGYYCANCGSLDVSMDNMERLECRDCGNAHAERSRSRTTTHTSDVEGSQAPLLRKDAVGGRRADDAED